MAKQKQVQSALQSIQQFQKKAAPLAAGKWQLTVPVFRLALEGLGIFLVAFMCGKGLGIFYEVMVEALFGV